jgi:hypothetical protein
MTNNRTNLAPFVVRKTLSIVSLGAEFTAAGEANSVLRLGIYADDGTGLPTGAAVLDAGSISTGTGNAGTVATGRTPGPYELTVSLTLQPGLYWAGGTVQGASTTQPTIRTVSATTVPGPMPVGTSMPVANAAVTGFRPLQHSATECRTTPLTLSRTS